MFYLHKHKTKTQREGKGKEGKVGKGVKVKEGPKGDKKTGRKERVGKEMKRGGREEERWEGKAWGG